MRWRSNISGPHLRLLVEESCLDDLPADTPGHAVAVVAQELQPTRPVKIPCEPVQEAALEISHQQCGVPELHPHRSVQFSLAIFARDLVHSPLPEGDHAVAVPRAVPEGAGDGAALEVDGELLPPATLDVGLVDGVDGGGHVGVHIIRVYPHFIKQSQLSILFCFISYP